MGVPGLSSFIIANADKFTQKVRLQNSYLVIDGNNLKYSIYYRHCSGSIANYVLFSEHVKTFFVSLAKCNITSIVVMDGGHSNNIEISNTLKSFNESLNEIRVYCEKKHTS